MTPESPNRREFLQATAAGLAAAGLAATPSARPTASARTMPAASRSARSGRTGEMVSLLCLGGPRQHQPQEALREGEPRG